MDGSAGGCFSTCACGGLKGKLDENVEKTALRPRGATGMVVAAARKAILGVQKYTKKNKKYQGFRFFFF